MNKDNTIIYRGYEDLEPFNEYIKRFGFIDYPTIHFSREDWEKLNDLAKTALANNKKVKVAYCHDNEGNLIEIVEIL